MEAPNSHIYLDNAATTPLDEAVLEEMLPYLKSGFGNPSSVHYYGRKIRAAIEKSRKIVADLINAAPSEVFFTSGGTEADNTFLQTAVKKHGITDIISTRIEHHAVLHTVQHLATSHDITLHFLSLDRKGRIDYSELEYLIRESKKPLVSLMHGNNEIGNLLDIDRVAAICEQYDVLFHSDTVQTVGHFPFDLQELKVDSIVASAHKFHGPKGIGFLYLRNPGQVDPLILGGSQERNIRGGTENVYGIIGLAKALQLATEEMADTQTKIRSLKEELISGLSDIEGVGFYGQSADLDNSLYTVLSVSLPPNEVNEMLLFNLDISKISASGGSACTSGSNTGSHVINELENDANRAVVRFSFSKYNTLDEVRYVIGKMKEIYS